MQITAKMSNSRLHTAPNSSSRPTQLTSSASSSSLASTTTILEDLPEIGTIVYYGMFMSCVLISSIPYPFHMIVFLLIYHHQYHLSSSSSSFPSSTSSIFIFIIIVIIDTTIITIIIISIILHHPSYIMHHLSMYTLCICLSHTHTLTHTIDLDRDNIFMPKKTILRPDGASLFDIYKSKKEDSWGELVSEWVDEWVSEWVSE